MSRRWLISVSLVAHIGLGIFLFATGVWRIEKLDGGRADLALAVMLPPAAPEGGPPPGEKPKDPVNKPRPKKLPDEIVQPEIKTDEVKPLASSLTNAGTGSGSDTGSGSGAGSGSGSGGCVGDDCAPGGEPQAAVCGNSILETNEGCDDGNTTTGDGCSAVCSKEAPKITIVPPSLFVGLRISGDTQVHPSKMTQNEMQRDRTERALGTLKVCIAIDGGISSVSVASSTKYPEYDARLVAAARGWRYRAYTVNGRPMPACSAVTFVYTMK